MSKGGYGICFNEWLDDERINNELNLLLRISSLTASEGYCYAGNEFFAKKLSVTTITISRKIKKLERLGYIKISYEYRGCEVKKREIRLTKMLTDGYQKKQSTVNKNVKENITSINIINSNKKNIKKINIPFEDFWELYDKKIDRPKCESKWKRLTNTEREEIMDYIPKYKKYQPDKTYRKNPLTFLNNRSWENEIIGKRDSILTEKEKLEEQKRNRLERRERELAERYGKK